MNKFLGSVDICGVDLFFVNLTDKYALFDRICLSQTSPQPVRGKLCLRVKLTKNKSTPQMSADPKPISSCLTK